MSGKRAGGGGGRKRNRKERRRAREDARPIVEGFSNPDVPAVSRRLDSLARLITGSDICAAVAFEGDKFLIANNNGRANAIGDRVFNFLQEVARRDMTLEQISGDRGLNREMQQIVEDAAQERAQGKKRLPMGTTKDELENEYKKRLTRDMAKIVSSLATDSDPRTRFPDEVKAAFRERKVHMVASRTGKKEIQGREKDVTVHAEMAILDEVVGADGFRVADIDVATGRGPFYMGITMLCCRNCHYAVAALNESERSRGRAGVGAVTVETRGAHMNKYDTWLQPGFFDLREDARDIYEREIGKNRKYHTTQLSPEYSDSESELSREGSPSGAASVRKRGRSERDGEVEEERELKRQRTGTAAPSVRTMVDGLVGERGQTLPAAGAGAGGIRPDRTLSVPRRRRQRRR